MLMYYCSRMYTQYIEGTRESTKCHKSTSCVCNVLLSSKIYVSMLSTIDCTMYLHRKSFIEMSGLWRGYVGLRQDMINYDLIYYPEPICNYQKFRHNLILIEQVPTLNKSGIGKDNKNIILL